MAQLQVRLSGGRPSSWSLTQSLLLRTLHSTEYFYAALLSSAELICRPMLVLISPPSSLVLSRFGLLERQGITISLYSSIYPCLLRPRRSCLFRRTRPTWPPRLASFIPAARLPPRKGLSARLGLPMANSTDRMTGVVPGCFATTHTG